MQKIIFALCADSNCEISEKVKKFSGVGVGTLAGVGVGARKKLVSMSVSAPTAGVVVPC